MDDPVRVQDAYRSLGALRPRCLLFLLILLAVRCVQASVEGAPGFDDANNSNTFIRWLVAQVGAPFRCAYMYNLVPRLSSACSKETDRVLGVFLVVQQAAGRSGQMMTYQEEE